MRAWPALAATGWAGRDRYTVMEIGSSRNGGFSAVWQAWRDDPTRCSSLSYVMVDAEPPEAGDIARDIAPDVACDVAAIDVSVASHPKHAPAVLLATLAAAWPPRTRGLHAIDFEGGRVQLLLAFGSGAARLLPALRLQADAMLIDGATPDGRAAMAQTRVLKAIGRRAAPAARLFVRVDGSDDAPVRANLAAARFRVEPPLATTDVGSDLLHARWAPRFAAATLSAAPRDSPAFRTTRSAPQQAVVVGAGIAGAAVAQALARLGVGVTVVDRQARPACETSGSPAGLFHGTVHPDDGPHARIFRAAACHAARTYRESFVRSNVTGAADGLLRLQTRPGGLHGMQALIDRQRLPPDYVRALDPTQASACAGVALQTPAWLYAEGGWLVPAEWVRSVLDNGHTRFIGSVDIARLRRDGPDWSLIDSRSRVVAQAPIVVLACAARTGALLTALGQAPWPLHHSRGQVTYGPARHPLRLPLAGDGYAVPLAGALLCGATREDAPPGDVALRQADQAINVERLLRLTGLSVSADAAGWQGWAGSRLHSNDGLPIAGAVPQAPQSSGQRLDQARLIPREDGLFVLTALGARGLTLAPLLGRLVAAQVTGMPWPLEQGLADAVDPARWIVRAARSGGG